MTDVRVVTLTCDFRGPVSAAELAAALLEDPRVATVRIGEPGSPSIVRVDVEESIPAAAAARASTVAEAVASRLGAGVSVRSAESELESDR
jgi:hypothetical protein